ncbi:MAG: GNAT family N-acetyltransferase [Bacillota bacterium]|jgi:RimJ/RimL family protein N-acetyltransferase|nr:GNAT family N-acetyltransferase [Bacillota bacterium]NLL26310.1 GNAT family N-acetyltransferase [Erysipelotrichia bacterium]
MINIKRLSDQYCVRRLNKKDVSLIETLQKGHPLYYEFCPPFPSVQGILNDLKALPANKKISDKFYLGFFQKEKLIAIMDLIVKYPNKDTVFIGFFMVDKEHCGQGIGSKIIEDCLKEFKQQEFTFVSLFYMKGNRQSKAFWEKCQFLNTGIETDNGQGTVVVLERKL